MTSMVVFDTGVQKAFLMSPLIADLFNVAFTLLVFSMALTVFLYSIRMFLDWSVKRAKRKRRGGEKP